MAVTRPKPTKKPVVGETFWGVREHARKGFLLTVERVGREYFYCDNRMKFSIKDYRHQSDFPITLFDDMRVANDWYKNIQDWSEFQRDLLQYRASTNLTPEQAKDVFAWCIEGMDFKPLVEKLIQGSPFTPLLSTEQIEQVRKWSEENEGKVPRM